MYIYIYIYILYVYIYTYTYIYIAYHVPSIITIFFVFKSPSPHLFFRLKQVSSRCIRQLSTLEVAAVMESAKPRAKKPPQQPPPGFSVPPWMIGHECNWGYNLHIWSMAMTQDPKMEGTVPYKAIFCGDIPLHRPYIGLLTIKGSSHDCSG